MPLHTLHLLEFANLEEEGQSLSEIFHLELLSRAEEET